MDPMVNNEMIVYERPMRKDFSRLGLAVLAMMAVWYAATYALAYGLRWLAPQLLEYPLTSWLVNDAALYLCGMPVFLFIIRRVEKTPMQKEKITAGAWIIALIIAIGVMMVGNMISQGVIYIYQAVTKRIVDNSLNEIIMSSSLWQVFLFSVVIAPIGEEFIFRRCLCDRLRKYGDLTAILISSWMFGCFHGNLFQIIYGFSTGAVLAYIYLRYGKLRYTALIHAALNFIGGFVPAAILKVTGLIGQSGDSGSTASVLVQTATMLIPLVYLTAMIGLSIAGLVLLIVYIKHLRMNKGEIALPPSRVIPVTFGNVGAVLLAIGFAALVVFDLLI